MNFVFAFDNYDDREHLLVHRNNSNLKILRYDNTKNNNDKTEYDFLLRIKIAERLECDRILE